MHRSSKTSPKPSKRVKEARHWDGVVSREEAASFDRSKSGDGGQVNGEFQPDVSTMAWQSTLTVSHQWPAGPSNLAPQKAEQLHWSGSSISVA